MTKRRKILIGVAVGAAVVLGGTGIALAANLGDEGELTGSDLDRATAAATEELGGGTVTGAELGDDGVAYEIELVLADGREVDVDLDAQFEVIATDVDEAERSAATGATGTGAEPRSDDLTGETLARASDAALAEVPGTVTDAEHADEGTGYEVTVLTAAGAEFDVVLDESFAVVSSTEDLED